LKTRYIVAVDTSRDTLMQITRKVSQVLGSGQIKITDQEDAMLNRDIMVDIRSLIVLVFNMTTIE
jgi:hypothetical protein